MDMPLVAAAVVFWKPRTFSAGHQQGLGRATEHFLHQFLRKQRMEYAARLLRGTPPWRMATVHKALRAHTPLPPLELHPTRNRSVTPKRSWCQRHDAIIVRG
jgi:hypothetical protein